MPVTPTYPGVYIQEIPSGVRTITGVATSIAAFIGRAPRGPVNEPVTINSFSDFERRFGGLQAEMPMTYAVRDFYANGGSQAIVIRLFNPSYINDAQKAEALDAATDVAGETDGADPAAAADAARAEADKPSNEQEPRKTAADLVAKSAEVAAGKAGATVDSVKTAARKAVWHFRDRLVKIGDITFEAANPGAWGNALRATLDREVSEDVAAQYGLTTDDLFNLEVRDVGTGISEKFLNLSLKESPRRVDRVLENESLLLRWAGEYPDPDDIPGLPDSETKDLVSAKQDVVTVKQDELAAAEASGDAAAITAAKDALKAAEDEFNSTMAKTEVTDGLSLGAREYDGSEADKTGLFALEKADLFNLLCIPPDSRTGNTPSTVFQKAMVYCAKRRAMLIVDPPYEWGKVKETAAAEAKKGLSELGLTGTAARNAALYFPRVVEADPLLENQLAVFAGCGIAAGVMARTDVTRGVWKAPAGLDASLNGTQGLQVNLTDDENGGLNPLGINCMRSFPVTGRVVWGARTLRGADQLADEYKYIPVRRLALFIEESLYRGTQWAVFEPNDEPLWAQLRLNIGAFMQNLFRQGAFQGQTPKDAYFVKVDKETTTQNDINMGIVNIVVGFAPLKPAEFVIIKLQQIAGQIET
jgi:phage tail sheath protein FI